MEVGPAGSIGLREDTVGPPADLGAGGRFQRAGAIGPETEWAIVMLFVDFVMFPVR